jgi:gluconokinase
MQLLADMFGKKIILNEVADASAVGAALIGMYATGFIKDVYEVKKFLKTDKVFIPNETNHHCIKNILSNTKNYTPRLKQLKTNRTYK